MLLNASRKAGEGHCCMNLTGKPGVLYNVQPLRTYYAQIIRC